MTYVSKGEKIFNLPLVPPCTPPIPKRSDGRLKSYSSILSNAAWSLEEEKRYRYLYGMMGGSQTCITSSSLSKFIPLEEIIKILLAEKDAYIKSLEKRLNDLNKTKDDISINELFKACQFEDEEQDMLNTRNRFMGPELEETKNTRDTLRQAMHKLENIDEIINENKCLKDKLRCSEEMIRYLEEKKSKLEKELENLRTKSQIQMDLQDAQENLKETIKKQKEAKGEELESLARERDHLQKRVCELQSELQEAKSKQSQLEILKKQSESTCIGVEEIIKENECYRKKLSSMKCLEKQILELKKQANILVEKYKRDASKASDQDKKMKCISKELQCLKEERDKLKNRVNELASYETQYNSFQTKLQQIDCILAENEMLNIKLANLDKLELENELLRCKLEKCQASELEAAESKEKIIELQIAVADQEEEMKDLLCQIERLTRAYTGSDELDRVKEELCEKDCKLKLCEEQLAEIPLLEAEIDELRSKLENCYNEIKLPTQKSRESGEVTTVGARYEDNVEFEEHTVVFEEAAPEEAAVLEKTDGEKGSMTCEEVQSLLQSSKCIINCVLEDMIEHQKEMEDLEKCNQEMKTEICLLKESMGETDTDNCFQQVAELKRVIGEKDMKICCLEKQLARAGDLQKVNEHIRNLECEIECLKNLNKKMRADLEEACCEVQRCAEIECMLEEERRAREDLARQLDSRPSKKSQKEEFNLEAKESSNPSLNELEDLKNNIEVLNKLVEELRKENALLKEMKSECPDYLSEIDEKRALEKLLCQLQSELDTCREEKLSDNCEDLKLEVRHLQEQNCQLKSLVDCYKERLDLERCSKQGESTKKPCAENLQDTNNKLRSEITRLRCESIELCKRIQKYEKQICDYENELAESKACCQGLEKEVGEKLNESEDLKGEVSRLLDETYKLASENDVLKNRLEEAESVSPEVQKKDYGKDLTEKHALESTMRNFEGEVDGLKAKLEECGKAEQERNNLIKKQEDLEAEIQNLKNQLAEATDPARSRITPEDKKEEIVEMREQSAKIQAEANEAKAENKKLKDRVDELQKQLDQCNKDKTNEEAQASLKSAKYQAMMSTVPPQSQGVPQTTIPLKEEQRVSVYERTTPGEVKQEAAKAKAAYIENQARPELVKVVTDAKDFKKEKSDEANSSKNVGFQPKKEAEAASGKSVAKTPSKTAISSSSKGAKLTPSKAAMLTPSKVATLTPSQAKMLTPSKAKIWSAAKAKKLTPSKVAMLTPSKIAMLSPSQAKMLTPSKAKIWSAAKAKKLTPSKAKLLTPSKVALLTPSQAKMLTPSKAKIWSAAKAKKLTPSKVAMLTPSKVEMLSPSQAKMLTPSKAKIWSAAKAKKLTPSKAAMLTPSKVALLTPSQAKMLTPSKAKIWSAAKAKKLTPSKAAMLTPSKVEMLSPSQAAMLTPSKAKIWAAAKAKKLSPSKAAMFTPSKLALMTPSQAAMLSPSMAAFVAASKAKKLTPSKAAMLTPSEVEMLSPSQAAMLTPSKAKIWAAAKAKKLSPSKAAMFTPSKLALMTPSQAAMLSPSMAAFVAAAKAKQSTPSAMALAKTSRPNDKGSKPSSAPDKLYPTDSDESFIDMTDADSDFSNFLCNLNPANHKENIREIEKRYQQKLGEINNKNEEKVRKLIQQHEKEERVREKMYNDNVSNMRTGYNSDIHKLLEKHKASILRLQNLHEEEVQELNTNYETQLEAMQTQNENIVNDLTMGATAKFKILADQHNRDMKELEKKYQELLEKKEKQHVTDLTNLNSGTAPTVDGKNKTRNERCMNASGEDGNVTDIKSKHDRELKNLKRSNLKRIDMIRHKYEDLLTCERRKYEKQLEDMVQRLSKGKAITQGICQCRIPGPFSSKDPNAPLEFNDVLQKILTGGLENLTFNEVALVHRKTCAATEDIVLNPEMRPELDPPIGEDIYNENELKANKKDLLNRILLMENDIAAKQKETQEAIVNMEIAVKAERQRLQELRDALRNERERNPLSNISKGQNARGDVKSDIDFKYTPTPEKDITLKLKELQSPQLQPMVPERDVKILHIREPSFESKRRVSIRDDSSSDHKVTANKMPRK